MYKKYKYNFIAFSWELEPRKTYITTDELKEEELANTKQKGVKRCLKE